MSIPNRDFLTSLRENPNAFSCSVEQLGQPPGVFLREDYLEPLGLSAHALAMAAGIPSSRLHEILHGRRSITPDTAIRLGLVLHLSAEYLMKLQATYDLEVALVRGGRKALAEVRPIPEVEAWLAKLAANPIESRDGPVRTDHEERLEREHAAK